MQTKRVLISKIFFQHSVPARYAVLGVLDAIDVTGFIATRSDADKADLLFETKHFLKTISVPSSVHEALKLAARNALWGVTYYCYKGAVWADTHMLDTLKHSMRVQYQSNLLERSEFYRHEEQIRPSMNLRMGSQLTPFPQPSVKAIAAIRAAAKEAENNGREEYAQSLYSAARAVF